MVTKCRTYEDTRTSPRSGARPAPLVRLYQPTRTRQGDAPHAPDPPVGDSVALTDPGRRDRLLALPACRNETRDLPGYLGNVASPVEGIVALADGSTDGPSNSSRPRPEVIELRRVPADRLVEDEVGHSPAPGGCGPDSS